MEQRINNLKLANILLTIIFGLVTGLLSRRMVRDPYGEPCKIPTLRGVFTWLQILGARTRPFLQSKSGSVK